MFVLFFLLHCCSVFPYGLCHSFDRSFVIATFHRFSRMFALLENAGDQHYSDLVLVGGQKFDLQLKVLFQVLSIKLQRDVYILSQ